MIPMTTARTVAPNLGGRANARSRAAVAIPMTAARRPLGEIPRLHGEIPRRHRGVRVVALSIAAIQTAIQPVRRHFPSVIGIAASNSPAGGGAHNSGSRSVVAHLSPTRIAHTCAKGPCAERDSTSVRVVPAIRGNQFNADRLTFVGLKNETDPDCPECSQGSAAHPGGRRHQRPPAFRSQIRQVGGCVRLSGGQTYQPSVCSYNRASAGPGLAVASHFFSVSIALVHGAILHG